ncbi:hypothetical protein LRQ20_09045, partial [Pseudomonas sp. MAFF 311096]
QGAGFCEMDDGASYLVPGIPPSGASPLPDSWNAFNCGRGLAPDGAGGLGKKITGKPTHVYAPLAPFLNCA